MSLLQTAQKWIYDALSQDEDLADAVVGVYNSVPPQGEMGTVVVFQLVDSSDVMMAGANRVGVACTFSVKVSGVETDAETLHGTCDLVDGLLHRESPVLVDGVQVACWRTNQFQTLEVAEGRRYLNVGGIYELHLFA